MTTFKLPERLGGGEFEEYRHVSGETEAPLGTVAFLVDDKLVCIAVSLLTEVRPEPDDGTDWLGTDGVLYSRRDNWGTSNGSVRWYNTDSNGPDPWEQLPTEAHPLIQLVPTPDPVGLPWTSFSLTGARVTVEIAGPVRIRIDGLAACSLSAANAHNIGFALISAAAQADREATS